MTEVKVFPVSDDKLKAFVSVVLDHCFMVNDIKVIEGRDGRFISMPSRRKRNGKFKDIAHPLNSETRSMLEQEILSEYTRIENGHGPSKAAEESAKAPVRGAQSDSRDGGQAAATQAVESDETDRAEVDGERAPESSLEEVTEKHLSDSFWTS